MAFIVGVDIGGTFTDAAAVNAETSALFTAKVRSDPHDLVGSVFNALELLAQQLGRSVAALLADTVKFAHGTTQTSNVLFTWSGARTGLLATRGFGDELLMMRARGRVAGMGLAERRHFRTTEKPPQLIPKALIEEVAERVDHRGRAVVPLTEAEATRAVDELLAKGVEAVAVSLLWSPANPAHELLLESVLRDRAPEVYVCLSHELAPVLGEYERTATAAVNAYVGPTTRKYLDELADRLRRSGLEHPLLVLQASGGVAQVEATVPIHTIESGPAAGMVASKILADAAGYRNVIATDVGGTTFKVGLIVDGEWSLARETIINQYTLLVPAIDLVSIGAGGGSIAWIDDTRLRVGPQSAGADPGPAAYGWGGTRATVTDADVVLGLIDPDRFLGGRLKLRADLAWRAVREQVAEPLFDSDVLRAAAGIRQIVDAQMGDLVHKMTIERGHDPRAFVLMAYGGAGPLHAVDYARAAGVRTVVVPPTATVYSAYGAAASDIHHSLLRVLSSDFPENTGEMSAAYAEMETRARELLRVQGIARDDMRLRRWADMRYLRQLHDVRVEIPAAARDGTLEEVVRPAFERRYRMLYGGGSLLPAAPLRVLRVGLDAIGAVVKPTLASLDAGARGAAARPSRPIYWPSSSARLESRVWDGLALRPGDRLSGPAVIELPGTTVALPPGVEAEIDRFGNTVIALPEAPA